MYVWTYRFNSVDFLFVSTRVARLYPDLMRWCMGCRRAG